jgi:arsenite methyltransferase
MNRLALAQLELGPQDKVLEVGFGGGALLASIVAVTSGQVIGVDASEAMVARARRRFRQELREGRLQLFCASAERLPLGDETVDKLCTVNSVYFWPDPHAAFVEFARVLKPSGRLVLCFEPAEELRRWPGHRFGFRLYEEKDVEELMRSAGFGSISTKGGRGRKPDRFLCMSAEKI